MDKPSIDDEEELPMQITLDKALKKANTNGYQVAKKLGKKPNFCTPWRKKGFDPKLSSAIRMADAIGCEVTDLFEKGVLARGKRGGSRKRARSK